MAFIAAIVGSIAGAIGSIGSFIGGLGLLGQALIGIGLNVATTLIQRQRQKKQQSDNAGVQFDKQYGNDIPRQVAVGVVGIAGHDCYVNTFNSANKTLQQIYTLSDYPIDGLNRVAINGKWQTLGGVADPQRGFPVTSGEFANLIWVKVIDGRQTASDAWLVAGANPSTRWGSDYVGLGIAYVIVTMEYDKEKNNAFPDFFFEFRGARQYDWRKDSTVGGSGSHRWNDPTTHEFSENPIVIEYNYRRGYSINNDMFCGMGMSANDLPLDKWAVAANLCDEITTSGEPRYRVSAMLNCMATHKENIEALTISCGSMVVDSADGTWPIVGSAQPVVMTFTDDDLAPLEPVQYRAKRSMSELVNSVSGSFPDPENLWSLTGYEAQISTAAITLDRRTRDLNIDFPNVRSQRQAAQLASIYLYENRYEATATITLRPRFQVLEVGDWVRWNSARYGNKVYIVTDTSLMSLDADGPRNAQISLQERDGSIYDGVTPPIINVPWPNNEPQYLNEVQDLTLIPVTVTADSGELFPGIRASWLPITDVTVVGVIVEYWPNNDPTKVFTRTYPDDVSVVVLTEGVVGGTEYTVRTKLITSPVRTIVWGTSKTVTTITIPPYFWPIKLENLHQEIKDMEEQTGNSLRQVLDELRSMSANLSSTAWRGFTDKQTIRRELRSQVDLNTASWTEAITVATGPNSALAQAIESLEAEVFDPVTGIPALSQAITSLQVTVTNQGGLIDANATAITALNTTVNGVSANATFRMQTVAAPAGWTARIAMQARIGTSDSYKSAGFYIDVTSTLSRIVNQADQFVITDGSTVTSPFIFTGGVAYMENARIGTVYFNQLSSLNGKLLIRGSGSLADISLFT